MYRLRREIICEISDKVGIKVKKAMICKWANEAMIEARKKHNMLRHAWINFGLYLPINGEKDDDMDTIAKKKLVFVVLMIR